MKRTASCLAFLIVPLAIFCASASAQLTGPASGMSTIPGPVSEKGRMPGLPQGSSDAMVFDGAIDPQEYRLGPGDVLQLRLWTLNESESITVSPEEMLIVPRVGEFSVKGKTLAEAKAEVYARANQIFRPATSNSHDATSGPISLTLYQPRRILVKVLGEVLHPGEYALTGATRPGVALGQASKEESLSLPETQQAEYYQDKREVDRYRPFFGDAVGEASQRYITITHDDGTISRVDLVRFRAKHEDRFAPLLREGDMIYVPLRSSLYGTVSVYGAVQAPGDFEFVDGDSLYSMVEACFGPTALADLTHVELTRSTGTNQFETRTINALAIQQHLQQDISLQSGDRIFIRWLAERREVPRVAISGEVSNPGVYPVRAGMKLTEVLREAGGFTRDAFPEGVQILRQTPNPLHLNNYERRSLLLRTSNLSYYDTLEFRLQSEGRLPTVSVDAERLFSRGDSTADIAMEDKDVIFIPKRPHSVFVSGYVGSSGFVEFAPNADVNYYIQAAGGYAEGAIRSKVRVIKARTKLWIEPGKTNIEPGDEVYVPKETEYPVGTTLQNIGAIAGLVGAAAYLFFSVYDRSSKK